VMDLKPEKLGQYKLLIAPYPVMMSRSHIQELIGFVKNGGTLVTEARCGWIDERGFSSDIYPGGGLHEIFGCRESYLMPLKKTSPIKIKVAHESLPLNNPGDTLDALLFEEGFELIDKKSQILAEFENGQPAIIYAPYGRGKGIIVGSFIGSAYHHFQNPNNAKFLAGLAHWLGISRPVAASSSDKDVFVEPRILEARDFKILFGFNRGDKKTQARFAVSVEGRNYAVKDLETTEKVFFRFQENRIVVENTLKPQQVWVVLIQRR